MKAKHLEKKPQYEGGHRYYFHCPHCNSYQSAPCNKARAAGLAGTLGIVVGALIAGPVGAAVLGSVGAAGGGLINQNHTCSDCGKSFELA